MSYTVGGQGPTAADDDDGGGKDDLSVLQHRPRHVTDPAGCTINSSRRSAHVELNARNSSGLQISRCLSSIQIFGRTYSVGGRTL